MDWVVKPKILITWGMVNETSDRPRLTAKGERTRARIVEEAARLIHERGVAGTTLDDVKAAAEVSGSQLYHYFPDKEELVQAVIDYQAETIVRNQRRANLGSVKGLRAWRNMVVTVAKDTQAKGGCPSVRSVVNSLRATPRPEPSSPPGSNNVDRNQRWAPSSSCRRAASVRHRPDDLAVTLLATLQGGLLLAQTQRSSRPFETAVDTLLALALRG